MLLEIPIFSRLGEEMVGWGVAFFGDFFCAALGICETLWSRGWVSLNLDVMLVFVRISPIREWRKQQTN